MDHFATKTSEGTSSIDVLSWSSILAKDTDNPESDELAVTSEDEAEVAKHYLEEDDFAVKYVLLFQSFCIIIIIIIRPHPNV